jgi:hypothetical protein
MKYRYLRIAFSCTCGIAAVLLIVLWVRSYRVGEWVTIRYSENADVFVWSTVGQIRVGWELTSGERVGYSRIIQSPQDRRMPSKMNFLGFGTASIWGISFAAVPQWFPLVLVVTLGTVPWLRWHFRLRTVLISITLIGLILGLIIATRR